MAPGHLSARSRRRPGRAGGSQNRAVSPTSPQATQAAATRSQLVAVARRLFAEKGYAATATEEIVVAAGVTRGALYYHFRDKQDLFRAVLVAVEDELHERVTAVVMAEPEMWDGLLAGCAAFLDAARDPAVRQIALVDAPAVLGWDEWREVGGRARFEFFALAFEWLIRAGDVPDVPVAPLAHVLIGALNEGARYVARAVDPDAARDEVFAAVTRLLDGLRA